MTRVVIIGGGQAGAKLAKQLAKNSKLSITVIEKQEEYFYNIGAVRAIVNPTYAKKCFIPYDRLFKSKSSAHKIINGTVISMTDKSVSVQTEKDTIEIEFDYCVIASGVSYEAQFADEGPYKNNFTSKNLYSEKLSRFAEAIKKSEKILLVGGGPVACETATEIKSSYPGKTVILASKKLLSSMEIREKSRKRLEAKLLNLGVTLMLRTTIEIPKDNEENEEIYYKGKAGWKTLAGDIVHADLVLDCRGILNPRTEFIQRFDSNILDTKRFIKVRKTFQVEGYDHIFAIGDVAASGAAKMTFLLDGQVSIVAKNINASLSKKALCNYKIPPYNTAIISVGLNDAWAAFGSFSNSISDFLGHKLKSKDLFLSMAKKTYGAK